MKLTLTLLMFVVILSSTTCHKDNIISSSNCFKGRLEIKAMCANYTIKLMEGNLDTSKIVASWKDDMTQKTYSNVFGLGSPCNFPDSIKEGQEFYFTLSDEPQNCVVCLAYYPTPPKKLRIKVVDHCH